MSPSSFVPSSSEPSSSVPSSSVSTTSQSTHQVLAPFHLAFPVDSLIEARWFYGELLGCEEGRSSDDWVDFNFFGHQLVAHLVSSNQHNDHHSLVDGHQVPVRHFGLALNETQWREIRDRLQKAEVTFLIEPSLRFKGTIGEQWTLFLADPSGNALEFKAMTDSSALFMR